MDAPFTGSRLGTLRLDRFTKLDPRPVYAPPVQKDSLAFPIVGREDAVDAP
jgi:hypothetical protein